MSNFTKSFSEYLNLNAPAFFACFPRFGAHLATLAKNLLLRPVLVLALALFTFLPAPACAEKSKAAVAPEGTKGGPQTLSVLRAEYVRLRNVDPTGDNSNYQAEWQELSDRIGRFLVVQRGAVEVNRLRFYAADVHLRLWRNARDPDRLRRAADVLASLLRDPLSSTQDIIDASLLRGDIALAEAESGAAGIASDYYRRALKASEGQSSLARQRLQGLSNKTFSWFIPSADLEVPRLLPPAVGQQNRPAPVRTVVLDPGHGGDDPGAVGVRGTAEKDVTLDVAARVRALLEEKGDIRVVLTRSDDSFVPLARRTAYANKRDAEVFVSLHVNATPSHQLAGLETYYLDNTDDAASRKLAERENAIGPGGSLDDVLFILSDLIQSGKLEDSIQLSHHIDRQVMRKVSVAYPKGRSLGVKKAPFFVLVGAHMPCSLVELFFVDHAADGAKLSEGSFRQQLAEGITKGIRSFLAERIPHNS